MSDRNGKSVEGIKDALLDDGSLRWTRDGIVYGKTEFLFDSDDTPVDSVKVLK